MRKPRILRSWDAYEIYLATIFGLTLAGIVALYIGFAFFDWGHTYGGGQCR